MPGRKLNQVERRLADFWAAPPAGFARPLLRQIRVEGGGVGIRGITSLLVPLPYPVTAICGRNSVGKSTVLSLAALSAKSPAAWCPYWGNTRPKRNRDVHFEYGFSDFFHRGPADPSFDGLRIGWVSLDGGNEIDLRRERRGSRWVGLRDAGRQGARAAVSVREIDFIPISRILPAGDQATLRNAFAGGAPPTIRTLSPAGIAKLSHIMGKEYQGAETRFVGGLGLPACNAGSSYSGFHMGSGESSIVVLLSRLENMPAGGLVVLEEAELGLHAEAQARLVDILLEYCDKKKIQIICTTHSEVILDRLPRIARVLLRKNGDEHEALTDISTRYCIHEMSGRAQPEMVVYCEDKFAAELIGEALAGPVRSRVRILDIGSNATLARQAVAHLRSQIPMHALSAFDGDCTDANVTNWITSERAERNDLNPDWIVLPADGLMPEQWLLREIATPNYLPRFADELNCTQAQATAHVEAMRVDLDNHDSAYTLSQRTGLDISSARRTLLRSVARDHPGLEPLRQRVIQRLGAA